MTSTVPLTLSLGSPARRHAHQFSPHREAGVSPNPAQEIELALSVAAQVDGARLDVDVHEVVHDLALDVVLDSVHQEPLAHIYDLDEGKVPGRGNRGEGNALGMNIGGQQEEGEGFHSHSQAHSASPPVHMSGTEGY